MTRTVVVPVPTSVTLVRQVAPVAHRGATGPGSNESFAPTWNENAVANEAELVNDAVSVTLVPPGARISHVPFVPVQLEIPAGSEFTTPRPPIPVTWNEPGDVTVNTRS